MKYIVYKLFFENTDGLYIGYTSDITRRIQYHKSCQYKNRKTSVSKWLYLNNNKLLQYEVLFVSDNEYDARFKETEIILKLFLKKEYLLNDSVDLNITKAINKNINCHRKVTKEYIILDKNGNIQIVKNLRQYALKYNYSYKDMCSCACGKLKSIHNLKVMYKDVWDKLTYINRQNIINNFKLYNPVISSAKNRMKTFWLVYETNIIKVNNLKKFALEHDLNVESLYLVNRGKQKQHKGYRVFLSEQDAKEYISSLN